MPGDSGYTCELRFDNESHDFVLGAEVGATFERLQREDGPLEATLHAANAEMILRMAEATWRTAQSEEMAGGWLHVTFSEPVRDSGFDVGDRVVVNGNAGTVTNPLRSTRGEIEIAFDDGPTVWSLLVLVEREAA